MSSASFGIEFYNWYKRYKVRAVDMGQVQDTFRNYIDGAWGGLGKAAVLDGLEIGVGVNAGNLVAGTSYGIAVSNSGLMMPFSDPEGRVVIPVPEGNPSRSYVVLRPVFTGENPITNPEAPFDSVFLNEELTTELVAISGTPDAAPLYPFDQLQPNDVILAGIRLEAGATGIDDTNIDFSVRDAFGKYSSGPKGVATYDDRLRAYAATPSVGITPSQPLHSQPMAVSYAGGAKPLTFPLSFGDFNPMDTELNFETGAITGGDQDSPSFTPTIPTAGNFIWAVITIGTNSLLSVLYGTQGTYAQCKTAMRNQTTVGAGAVPVSAAAKIAFILVGSADGATIREMEIVDARGPGNYAVTQGATVITSITDADSPYTMDGTEQHIEVDASGGDVQINLPDRAANQGTNYPMDRIDDSANDVTVEVSGADEFADAASASYPMDPYQSQDFFAGATKWKVRG